MPHAGGRVSTGPNLRSGGYGNRRFVNVDKEDRHMNGTVKRVVGDRGFGFIAGEDGSEYFFHRDQLQGGLDFDTLRPGERVTFETQAGPKGPRAVAVQRA